MYNIVYSDIVIHKHLSQLSTSVKKSILQAIEKKLLVDPIKFGKPLRYNLNKNRCLRVGDYRVIYQIEETMIKISVIKHRKDCYNLS
jgi:mRNA interferase RelE/StbE